MKTLIILLLNVTVLALPASAALFGPKGDNVDEKRAKVREQRDQILAKLYATHPEAKDKIKKAAGYGAFNNKNMNLFLLSSGHGYGVVVDGKTGKETFMAMGSLGGGVGMGAKDLSVVFIFKNADVMKKFVDSGWQFGGEADATAKAGEKGGAASKEAGVDTGANVFELSAEDARKFWPLYREYENELGKQAENRAEFVVEFVQAHKDGSFNNAKARDMAKRWFKAQRARLSLLEKYHDRIEKSLSSVQAGQFLQIENQIFIFIDMTIASEMPRVGEKIK